MEEEKEFDRMDNLGVVKRCEDLLLVHREGHMRTLGKKGRGSSWTRSGLTEQLHKKILVPIEFVS